MLSPPTDHHRQPFLAVGGAAEGGGGPPVLAAAADKQEGDKKEKDKKPQQVRGIVWTLNAQGENGKGLPQPEDIMDALGGVAEVVFQLEKGKETGRWHYQGYCYNTAAKTLTQWRNKLPPGTWIMIMKAHTRSNAWEYCCKENTRVTVAELKANGFPRDMAGPHVKGIIIPQAGGGVHDPLKDKELYPWQEELEQRIKGPPSDRSVIWIHEPDGKCGKSAFTKHLALRGDTLVVGGKAADSLHGIRDWVNPVKGTAKKLHIVVIDIPRCQKDFVSYQTMEKAKDGCFFSGKYEGTMTLYNPPHILVFSNQPPDRTQMSADRWEIFTINSKKELVADHPVAPIFKASTETEVSCKDGKCSHGTWDCTWKAAATAVSKRPAAGAPQEAPPSKKATRAEQWANPEAFEKEEEE